VSSTADPMTADEHAQALEAVRKLAGVDADGEEFLRPFLALQTIGEVLRPLSRAQRARVVLIAALRLAPATFTREAYASLAATAALGDSAGDEAGLFELRGMLLERLGYTQEPKR